MSIYSVFRQFLRDNGCEEQFDSAFHTQCGANVLDEALAEILVIDESFINRCFDWSSTAEGRQFWKNLDEKWWKYFKFQLKSRVQTGNAIGEKILSRAADRLFTRWPEILNKILDTILVFYIFAQNSIL